MSASRLPQACLSGQVHGPAGSGWPKNSQPCKCTLVFPNWSRYLRKSNTWLKLHCYNGTGGLWFLKYCPKVFQSRRFWDSYLLNWPWAGCCCWSGWSWVAGACTAEADDLDDDDDDPSPNSIIPGWPWLLDIMFDAQNFFFFWGIKELNLRRFCVWERLKREMQVELDADQIMGLLRRHGMGPRRVL